MSMTSLLRTSLRTVSNCLRTYAKSTVPMSYGEAAVHKALGAEGAYRNIGIGPYATYKHMGQQIPRAYKGPGKMSVRFYKLCHNFIRSYQYGRRPNSSDSSETVLRVLVGANVLVWASWQLDPAFMAKHFTTSLSHIREGRLYTIMTATISQHDLQHLICNMLPLYFFWNRAFSGRLVVFVYLVGGSVGSLALLCQKYWQLPSLRPPGPSGWGLCPHFVRAAPHIADVQFWPSVNREWGIRRSSCLLGASASISASVIFNICCSPRSTFLMFFIVPMPAWAVGGLALACDIAGAMGWELIPGDPWLTQLTWEEQQ